MVKRMFARAAVILRSAAAGLADLVWPDVCGACGAADADEHGLCDECNRAMLAHVSLPYCRRCGSTLGPHVAARDDGCWSCPATLFRFNPVIRLGPYAGPLRGAVHRLKYRRGGCCGRLASMLAEAVAAQPAAEPFDLVMPIPMHWRRRLARGHDHARMLACGIGRRLGLPVGDELIRVRNTPPQVHLSRTRRMANVRNAFSVARPRSIAGATVLLVDDVTTTGATSNEAARTLLRAGAEHVALAVVAKAEPPTAYTDYWDRSN